MEFRGCHILLGLIIYPSFDPIPLVDCCGKDVTEQRVQTDGHADGLPPGGDHHAVAGPPQHHQALRRGAHAAPEDGKTWF